jgi:hypothetical protein
MSLADTAEYQLAALADEMTALTKESSKAGWRSEDYRDGFTDAMNAIASAMGLSTETTYIYP